MHQPDRPKRLGQLGPVWPSPRTPSGARLPQLGGLFRLRQKVSAPARPAIPTARSDLFGRPPSTDGVALFALRFAKRLPIFQTPQPRTAFRRLTIPTARC